MMSVIRSSARRAPMPDAARHVGDPAFFRTNQTPIYFVSPTAFNLLGIDRWVRDFFYVTYFDSFEGAPPARVRPARARRTASSRRSRTSTTTCCAHKEVARLHRRPRTGRQGRVRDVRRGDRGAGAEAGLEVDPPARGAARRGWTPRSSPRSSATRPACRACRTCSAAPSTYEELLRARRDAGPRRRPGRADARTATPARRRSSSAREARLGPARRRPRRPGAEGDEADQQPRGGRRGRDHAPRHARRAVHDAPDRPPRADAVQGRLVRQRHLPGRAHRRPPRPRRRD